MALPRGWLLAGVIASGTVLGIGVGVAAGGADTVVVLASVPLYDCPAGSTDGALHSGDRVFATARDDTGDWLEVRSPRDQSVRVWIEAQYVDIDRAGTELDVRSCDDRGAVVLAPVAETPTTTGPESSGGPGGNADTTGPAITGVSANPKPIWEENLGTSCNANATQPIQSTVSAQVNDPAGVTSVTMSWQVASTTGSKPMTGAGTYSAVLGPFPETTIATPNATITVTITARDNAGNTRTVTTNVVLNDCVFI